MNGLGAAAHNRAVILPNVTCAYCGVAFRAVTLAGGFDSRKHG